MIFRFNLLRAHRVSGTKSQITIRRGWPLFPDSVRINETPLSAALGANPSSARGHLHARSTRRTFAPEHRTFVRVRFQRGPYRRQHKRHRLQRTGRTVYFFFFDERRRKSPRRSVRTTVLWLAVDKAAKRQRVRRTKRRRQYRHRWPRPLSFSKTSFVAIGRLSRTRGARVCTNGNVFSPFARLGRVSGLRFFPRRRTARLVRRPPRRTVVH